MAFSNSERFTLVDVNGVFLASPGDELTIREPVNFSQFISNVKRDDEYFGVNAEYGESSSELGFSWVSGQGEVNGSPHEMLQAILLSESIDGEVLLRYYVTYQGTETLDYEWSLVFKSANEVDDNIFFRVKRENFGDKLRTRFDTVVDVESTVDLDDNANSALTLIELPLHARTLRRNTEVSNEGTTTSVSGTGASVLNTYSITLGFPFSELNEVLGFFSPFTSIQRSDGSTNSDPLTNYNLVNNLYLINCFEKGVYNFSINVSGSITFRTGFTSTITAWSIYFWRVIKRYEDGSTSVSELFMDSGSNINGIFTQNYSIAFSEELDLNLNDEIYFYGYATSGRNITATFGIDLVEDAGNSITLDSLTTFEPSTTTGHFAFEILDKALSKVTGETGSLTQTSVNLTMYRFEVGELISGATSGETATIDQISSDETQLILSGVSGDFTVNEQINGSTTNANGTLESYDFVLFLNIKSGSPSPGDSIEGKISGATADIVSQDGVYFTVENVVGTFTAFEELNVNGSPTSIKYLSSSFVITLYNFTVTNTLTGGTSGDSGEITAFSWPLIAVSGSDPFENDEIVSDGSATARIEVTSSIYADSTVLNSTFLSKTEQGALSDAYGSLNFITSGKKVRGLTSNSNLKVTVNDLIDFYKTRYGCGWSVVNDQLVLERASNFFRDVQIAQITAENSNENKITRTINTDLVFNTVQCGYKKYAKENEDGSIDGFNTLRKYQSPIIKEKKDLSLIAPVITDSAELERIRRLTIKQDESDQSDDEIIVIKCQRFNASNPIDTNLSDGYFMRVNVPGNYVELDGYYLKGQADNATQFNASLELLSGSLLSFTADITAISYDATNNKTVITTDNESTSVNGSFAGTFWFEIDIFLPERIEPFSTVSGVDDKYTEYNIDHAPTNFLFQNWQIFGASHSTKDGTKKIKFTQGVNTVSLTKAYSSSSGSYTTNLITEDDDFLLSTLNFSNPPILKPWKWELVAYVDYQVWKGIRAAMLGLSSNNDNYGYISFSDFFGNLVRIFPYEIKREEKSQKLTIIGWEKEVPTPAQTYYLLREDGTLFEREDGTGYYEREH